MNQKITITEALAEIKLISNKIDGKIKFISEHVAWNSRLKDPLENVGGSTKIVSQELQAVTDLTNRLVLIRNGIAKSNSHTMLNIDGTSMSVSDWLVWRREVAPKLSALYNQMDAAMRSEAARIMSQTRGSQQISPDDLSLSVSPKSLSEWQQHLQELLDKLDGQLSLLNARTEIEV